MLHLIGAGGHASVTADVARRLGIETVELWAEDPPAPGAFGPGTRYHRLEDLDPALPSFLALGNLVTRARLRLRFPVLARSIVDPSALLGWNVTIADGALVMPGCILNANTSIDTDAIVNTATVIEHDCYVGSNSHLASGVRLAGGVRIGAGVLVGIGAAILPGVTVGDDATIGAGAVVRHDVLPGTLVVGVPARQVR